MGNLFDIALVLIILISCSVCWKLGLFKTLKPFRKTAAFIIAWNFKSSPIVTEMTDKILKADAVKNGVSKWVKNFWGEKITSATGTEGVSSAERFEDTFGVAGQIFGNIKEYCCSLYEGMFLGAGSSNELNTQAKIEEFTEEVMRYLSDGILRLASGLLGFFLIYVAVSIAFLLAIKLFDAMFSKGVFGFVNKVTGGAIGMVIGFVVAWILSVLFVNVLPIVFPIEQELILSGNMGVVNWFYNGFMPFSFF